MTNGLMINELGMEQTPVNVVFLITSMDRRIFTQHPHVDGPGNIL